MCKQTSSVKLCSYITLWEQKEKLPEWRGGFNFNVSHQWGQFSHLDSCVEPNPDAATAAPPQSQTPDRSQCFSLAPALITALVPLISASAHFDNCLIASLKSICCSLGCINTFRSSRAVGGCDSRRNTWWHIIWSWWCQTLVHGKCGNHGKIECLPSVSNYLWVNLYIC